MRLVAGISDDEKVIAICDKSSLRGFDVRTAKAVYSKTMAELGMPGGPYVMAMADGLVVLVDGAGRTACVDVAKGEVLWSGVALRGRQNGAPVAPPDIRGRKVLIRLDSGQKMVCLDANDHGRVVGEWQGNQFVDGAFAPNGNLAVMTGSSLSVYDAAQLGGKPLWVRNYPQRQAVLLAVSNDFVAVSPNVSGTVVEVLPMTDGSQPAMSISLPEVGGAPSHPLDALIDGSSLLVTTSPTQVGFRVNMMGQQYYLQGLGLHRIDLEKKRRAWSYEVEGLGPGGNIALSEPVVGLHHVAILARSMQGGGEPAVHVIDLQTGKRAGKIDLLGRSGIFEPQQQRRLQMIGPPVMTNGRLSVETLEGVVVYGGQ
jgi:hypothetical protein